MGADGGDRAAPLTPVIYPPKKGRGRMEPQGDKLGLLLKAMVFSANRHRRQRRKGADASPYINHLLEVADLLANVGGVGDPTILVAAVLHDTVEDTATSLDELEALFGPDVRRLVEQVSDNRQLSRAERKRLQIEHAPGLPASAKLLKLADKIANVRDVTRDPPTGWPLERRREYLDWAEQVVAGCRGVNEPLERFFDRVVREGREALTEEEAQT